MYFKCLPCFLCQCWLLRHLCFCGLRHVQAGPARHVVTLLRPCPTVTPFAQSIPHSNGQRVLFIVPERKRDWLLVRQCLPQRLPRGQLAGQDERPAKGDKHGWVTAQRVQRVAGDEQMADARPLRRNHHRRMHLCWQPGRAGRQGWHRPRSRHASDRGQHRRRQELREGGVTHSDSVARCCWRPFPAWLARGQRPEASSSSSSGSVPARAIACA